MASPGATHRDDCRWVKTTVAQCPFRATHYYCPHPEHACNCRELAQAEAKVADAKKPFVARRPDTGRVIIVAAHPDTGELQRMEIDGEYAWALASDVVILGDKGSYRG